MRRVFALLVIVLEARAGAQVLSPGALSEAHAGLEGDASCGKCHSSGKQVADDRCLGCHTDLAKRIRAQTGLHGRAYREQRCESCHLEHIGKNARIVRWPGGDMTRLDHALTGWKLEGAHQKVACARCHRDQTPAGRPTFLGAATSCASCHTDAHKGRFGQACAGCHQPTRFSEVAIQKFDHSLARFPLAGAHQKVACKGCHGEPAVWQGLKFDDCSGCHTDPHKGRFQKACSSCHSETGWKAIDAGMRRKHPGVSLGGGHARVGCATCHDRGNDRPPSRGNDCVSCHRPVHEAKLGNRCESCHESIRWLGLPREIGVRAHAQVPFPLEGRHADVACDGCHLPSLPVDRRYRKLAGGRCGGCHRDQHAGEFAARGGGECAPCHTAAGFSPTMFGAVEHASTAFPLDGKHLAAPCSACHSGAHPRLGFHVAKRTCADCHQNPHGTQFATEMASGGCVRCHITADWRRAQVDHSIWPLTGVHARTACSGCHRTAAAGAAKESYRGGPRDCAGCHEDVHAGQFRLTEPVRTCETCHTTDGFDIQSFDHAKNTVWPLDGKHGRIACDACHGQEKLRNGQDAVRWRLGYHQCRDCHANPHREAKHP